MKKYSIFSTMAVMVLAAVSCNKEMTPEEGVAGGNSVKVTITTAPELAMDTKTTITQDPSDPNLYIPSWLGTEKMGVWVDDIPANGEAQPEFLTNTEAGPVATFTGDIEITAGQHIIYGYASSAEKYFNKYYPGSLVGFDIPQVQYPTLTSFDSDADLLIAKAQTVEVSDGQTDLSIDNVQFTRALAVLKVILKDGSSKGVKGNAVVKSLTLSPSDVDNEPLTGRASIDVKNGGSITKFNTNTDVKAEYTDESFVINDENAAWLVVNPLTFGASSTLTLSVDAGKYVINKTLNVAGIELKRGDITVFDVTLKDEDVEVVEAGLALPFEDDFSEASSGQPTSSGSGTEWKTSSKFEITGSVYQAGGAIRLGKDDAEGKITTLSTLDLSQPFTVIISGTGWSSKENGIVITAGTQSQTLNFTTVKEDGKFEYLSAYFKAENSMTKIAVSNYGSGSSYHRVFLDNIEIVSGEWTPEPELISVGTGKAAATETSAVLSGVYEARFLGEEDVIKYGFEWGTDASALASVEASNAVDGEFSYDLSGLTTGTTYIFKAWAQLNDGEKMYGEELTFEAAAPVGIEPSFNITSYNSIPEGWEGNVATGSYFNLKENTYLTSPMFNMDGYTSAEISIALGTYGGANSQTAVLNVSYDGGITYTEIHEFDVPASSDEEAQTYSLKGPYTSTVVLKLTPNDGCTGNYSVRIQDYSLTATK